ncbi:MAG: leucine-rich repeat domain-containing protein, partial [Dolichospermum sp.]
MTDQELLQIIEKAARNKETTLDLDLCYNQLTTLPEAIAQLSNLSELDLSNNQLTTLPEAIAQLSNLSELD